MQPPEGQTDCGVEVVGAGPLMAVLREALSDTRIEESVVCLTEWSEDQGRDSGWQFECPEASHVVLIDSAPWLPRALVTAVLNDEEGHCLASPPVLVGFLAESQRRAKWGRDLRVKQDGLCALQNQLSTRKGSVSKLGTRVEKLEAEIGELEQQLQSLDLECILEQRHSICCNLLPE